MSGLGNGPHRMWIDSRAPVARGRGPRQKWSDEKLDSLVDQVLVRQANGEKATDLPGYSDRRIRELMRALKSAASSRSSRLTVVATSIVDRSLENPEGAVAAAWRPPRPRPPARAADSRDDLRTRPPARRQPPARLHDAARLKASKCSLGAPAPGLMGS